MAEIQEVERYVLQVALARGWVAQTTLQQAAKFRQNQTDQGRKTTLLRVLRPFVTKEAFRDLEILWAKASRYSKPGQITDSALKP